MVTKVASMAKPRKVYPNRVKAQFFKESRKGKRINDYEAEFAHYYEKGLIRWGYGEIGPAPRRQFKPFHNTKHTCDFAFPHARLIVEIDGGQWVANGGRHNRDSDREKLNRLAVDGWRVMRFSGQMILQDPNRCIDMVMLALRLIKPGENSDLVKNA